MAVLKGEMGIIYCIIVRPRVR